MQAILEMGTSEMVFVEKPKIAVRLDDLVLLNCMKHMESCCSCVRLEAVSHRLFNVLQAYYKMEHVIAVIRTPEQIVAIPNRNPEKMRCYRMYISGSGRRKQLNAVPSKIYLCMMEVKELFTRFKYFDRLELSEGKIFTLYHEFIETLLTKNCHPIKIKRFHFNPTECNEEDIRLVEALLTTTGVMHFSLSCGPATLERSQALWGTVAKCGSLSKLTYNSGQRRDEFADPYFRSCVKLQSLKEFTFNCCRLDAGSYKMSCMDFLDEVFSQNNALRRLSIGHSIPSVFVANSVLPIIGRLRTLKLDFSDNRHLPTPKYCEDDLLKILLALPVSGYLTVEDTTNVNLGEMVTFWLKLSFQARRTVHLILYCGSRCLTVQQEIENLPKSESVLAHLIVERKRNIVLRQNGAKIIVKVL